MLAGCSALAVRRAGGKETTAASGSGLGSGRSPGSVWLNPQTLLDGSDGRRFISGCQRGGWRETSAECGSLLGSSLISPPTRTAAVTAGSAGRLRGGGGDDNTAESDSGLGVGCCVG